MAQNPLIKRYLDAGMAFTQMTQSRAEAIVKELVKAGEVQAQKTEELVNSLVERSRQNTDRLLELVRKEVRSQVVALGLATQDDIARLDAKIAQAPAGKAAAKKAPVRKKAGAKKTATKKTGAKKAGAKKTGTAAERSTKKRATTKSTSARDSS